MKKYLWALLLLGCTSNPTAPCFTLRVTQDIPADWITIEAGCAEILRVDKEGNVIEIIGATDPNCRC